jgi:DNA-directed RNA polymerase alpha subunit
MALMPIFCPHCNRMVGTVNTVDNPTVVQPNGHQVDLGLLSTSVGDIEWPYQKTRINNVLRVEQIFSLGDLVVKSERELLRIPNMGQLSIKAIKEKLQEFGLQLGMDAA